MSQHTVSIFWENKSNEFAYEKFDRTHLIRFSGGNELQSSTPPDYLGNAALANPEELFISALSSCFMLTFLAIASKQGFRVQAYEDHAEGIMGKNEQGRIYVAEVNLHPKIKFSGDKIPDQAVLNKLSEQAHKYCFIANSVKTAVVAHLQMVE